MSDKREEIGRMIANEIGMLPDFTDPYMCKMWERLIDWQLKVKAAEGSAEPRCPKCGSSVHDWTSEGKIIVQCNSCSRTVDCISLAELRQFFPGAPAEPAKEGSVYGDEMPQHLKYDDGEEG